MVKDAIEKYPIPITLGSLFGVAILLVTLTWKVTIYTNNLETQVRLNTKQCETLGFQIQKFSRLEVQIEKNTSSIDKLSSQTGRLNFKLEKFLGKFDEEKENDSFLITGG